MSKNICRFLLFSVLAVFNTSLLANDNPQALIKTNRGDITIELYPNKAPKTVENFIRYINESYYNKTIFHRVISGFMIQGGGYTKNYSKKSTNPAIAIESNNGLTNSKGSIAMARTQNPHSATSQFFINLSNNDFLNYKSMSLRGWGYTVFGRVIKGMLTVEDIGKQRTGSGGPFMKDAPRKQVIIQSITLINQ
ncbi:MAG: peptidyl-prolyl cis-trans isomerase [Methylococcales bacterium]|jgi:peptidyl-prolyl cis-trans isomerase A (cyclophilin A)/peptidyl-prolyl cis-trans isomerase B (cyclophilin B)|nr:peptidyl-prolyl cis-trans isomerase [Methylococcales bacterium]MBT7409900.1 peptidyl-prolyl cis-trans isomerase [Methylococcales bacterium]